MATVLRRREVIDRGALNAQVAALGEGRGGAAVRADILRLLKEAHARGRTEIRRRFADTRNGVEAARSAAFLMDQLIRVIYDDATLRAYPAANPTAGERFCVAAVGGYGRGELAPHSDIDLLFVLPYKETPRQEQVIEHILYFLWDLGLKVGHATRSLDDCIRSAREDATIRTAILESRYLWGDKALFRELGERFEREVCLGTGIEYVEAKLAERDERHQRLGDSRYVLEPNVKDGKGGLRDLHTLFWIAKDLYKVEEMADLVEKGVLTADEARRFEKAKRFLWTVRVQLHYLAGRGEDRLTFDRQPELAAAFGYRDRARLRGVERFMKHYYLVAKEVGDLTRIFCAALEAEHRRKPRFSLARLSMFERSADGFPIEGGRLSLADAAKLERDPVAILRLFHTAQKRDLDVHPRALKAITRSLRLVDGVRDDPDANRLFMEMLTSPKDPETTLRRLNEAGVFGRFMPDFGRVVAQMQHDMYHSYTVDEHTIRAIGILEGVEKGRFKAEMPVASEIVHKVQSRRALYFALLLHDIAKGRGGDHSVLGAEVALRLGPRVGLSAEETETVAWLVRYHLIMSNTAFRRDIHDPKTIADFVATVQSLERLRLLLVLTVADIRAVGPTVWNAWKAALLRELYFAAEEVLSGGNVAEHREARVAAAKDQLRQALADFAPEEIEAHLARGYPNYWLAFGVDTHAYHARIVRAAERLKSTLTIEKRIDRYRAVTEITIYTADHPGLFAEIAGAMAIAGANIVDAKIFTLTNGMALDTFSIQDAAGGAFDKPERLARLATRIEQALTGRLAPMRELAGKREIKDRTRVFKVAPRVFIDNEASRTHTVIEINGRDRPGLLYELTHALSAQHLQIASALVATYGETAVDVFYVKDLFGLQIRHDGKLATIREALLDVLGRAADGSAAANGAPPGRAPPPRPETRPQAGAR
jgi:[protein-PII] uridylyltransferase